MDELVGLLFVLGVWLLFCWAVSKAATQRGRSPSNYFWLSFLLSPILGYVILLIHGTDAEKLARDSGEQRKCPMCAEWVQRDAKKCRYCGEMLPAPEHAPAAGVFKL